MSVLDQRLLSWHKSTACVTGECVEVAYLEGRVLVRNSRLPGVIVRFAWPQWKAFITAVAASPADDHAFETR